jgi:SAM-dependent methyltransferase
MTGMNPAEFANIAQSERDFWWYRGMRSILFRLLGPLLAGRKPSRVLEAGCGTGYLSALLQNERNWPMVPIDLSSEGLRYTRSMGLRSPVQADICHLPFADESFDLALSMDVYVHLERGGELTATRELARVLRPGGLAVVRAAAFHFLRSRHSEFVFERQRFTRAGLRRAFAASGLRVVRETYANTLLSPIAAAKFRIWEPLTTQSASSGVEPVAPWLDRLLGAPLAIEAACLGAGLNFPFGQSVFIVGEKRK